jgi:hypothetical protein
LTLIPLENRDVKGLNGLEFPAYRVPALCSHPRCSRVVVDAHHLFRRSFLAGAYPWVELPDHRIVGNVAGLCRLHHDQVTANEAWIRWLVRPRKDAPDVVRGRFWWCARDGRELDELYPHPPLHGLPLIGDAEEAIVGPAARPVCPGCGRTLPHQREPGERLSGPRRRKSWVVKVPADSAEDGALVLDVLIDACADLFSHEKTEYMRYFTIAQMGSLILQNKHLLSDGTGGE